MAAGLCIASAPLLFSVDIRCTSLGWLNSGGRKCFICRSVICRCRSMIDCGWLQIIITSRQGWKYCATLVNTWCVWPNAFLSLSNATASLWKLMCAMTVPWSSWATLAVSDSVDPDMVADRAPWQMPKIHVNCGWARRQGYCDDQWNPPGLRWYRCCCNLSNRGMCLCGLMSFAFTRFSRVTREPRMGCQVWCPVWSKHWVFNLKSAAIYSCLCPKCILIGRIIQLFPKWDYDGFFLEGYHKYDSDILESIQWFKIKNKGWSASRIKPDWSALKGTVVLLHLSVVIAVGVVGFQIR